MRPTGPAPLDAFLAWVVPRIGKRALPSPFRGPYGLGLRAPAPAGYRAGEAVLTIPVSLWGPVSGPFALKKAKTLAPAFHAALVSLDASGGSSSGGGSRGLTAAMALATHLGLALLDEADPIHPYARFLYESSQAATAHPLLLGSDALQRLFQASPVVPALEKRQRVYASLHGRLFPDPQAAPLPFPLFLWAVTRVLSRAISGPGRPVTLVPYFDLLNHSPEPNCEYEVGVGAERSDIVVRAMRDMRPDEELFISYGDDKDNHRLLTTYGFVQRGNPNPVRVAVEVTEEGGQPPPSNQQQRALLERLGADASASEPLVVVGGQPDALPTALATRLVLASSPSGVAALGARVDGLQGTTLADAVLAAAPAGDRARVLDAAARAVDARLRAYGTSEEEDRAALKELEGEMDGLEASALLLRVAEKAALRAGLAWIEEAKRRPRGK